MLQWSTKNFIKFYRMNLYKEKLDCLSHFKFQKCVMKRRADVTGLRAGRTTGTQQDYCVSLRVGSRSHRNTRTMEFCFEQNNQSWVIISFNLIIYIIFVEHIYHSQLGIWQHSIQPIGHVIQQWHFQFLS